MVKERYRDCKWVYFNVWVTWDWYLWIIVAYWMNDMMCKDKYWFMMHNICVLCLSLLEINTLKYYSWKGDILSMGSDSPLTNNIVFITAARTIRHSLINGVSPWYAVLALKFDTHRTPWYAGIKTNIWCTSYSVICRY